MNTAVLSMFKKRFCIVPFQKTDASIVLGAGAIHRIRMETIGIHWRDRMSPRRHRTSSAASRATFAYRALFQLTRPIEAQDAAVRLAE
jgi:hypothetical protein